MKSGFMIPSVAGSLLPAVRDCDCVYGPPCLAAVRQSRAREYTIQPQLQSILLICEPLEILVRLPGTSATLLVGRISAATAGIPSVVKRAGYRCGTVPPAPWAKIARPKANTLRAALSSASTSNPQ